MKRGLLILILLLVGLLVTLGAIEGPSFFRMVKAKDRLNNGAIAYHKGNYDEAIALFKESMELYPQMKQSKLYYAAALYAKYTLTSDPQLALDALKIYEESYKEDPTNPDVIAYIAIIHKNLADSAETEAERQEHIEQYRQWTLKRLDVPGITPKQRAEIYYTLGQGYWLESYQITQQYVVNRPPQPVSWNIPDSEIPKIKQLAQAGLEYLNKAVEIDPEYGDAWAYLNLLYFEQAKAEKDPRRKAELMRLKEEAYNRALELGKKKQQQQQSPQK